MEQNTEQPTQETHAEESQLNSPAGETAESVATDKTSAADTFSLEELNALTGRNYKDKETALKSIKDMQSQAGKAADLEGKIKQAQTDPATSSEEVAKLQEQLNAITTELTQTKHESFFNSSEEYRANRALIEKLAKADGVSPQEVVESDVYKSVAKEPEKRTVAASNNRVAQSSKEFNAKDHAGDATTLARHVVDNFLIKNKK